MKRICLIACLFFILMAPVSAVNVTYDRGDSWIGWTWDLSNTSYSESPVDVYIDGTLFSSGVTGNYLYTGELSSDSEHQITLKNDTTVIITENARTLPSLIIPIIMGLVGFVLAVFTLLIEDEVRRVLCGVVAIIASIIFSLQIFEHSIAASILGIILAVFVAIILALTFIDTFSGGGKNGW